MRLAAMLGMGMPLAVAIAGDIQPPSPTARDAIETARFMTDRALASGYNPDGAVSISPNGRRYVARVVRGDVQRNGVSMQLITGGLDSLEQASNARTVAQLFSSGRGARNGRRGADQDALPVLSGLRWPDDDRVAFLWSDEREIPQVTRVDLTTGKVDRLTQHPSAVISFDIGAAGEVLYQALLPPMPSNLAQALREGFAVEPDTDAAALILGLVNAGPAGDRYWNAQWFLARPGAQPLHIRFGRDAALNSPQRAWFSPAGGRAIVSTNATTVPEPWSVYDDEYAAHAIRTARLKPNDLIGRRVHQLFLLDTDSAEVRPLWSAVAMSFRTQVSWSPDGGRLLLAPTFLPPQDDDPRGRSGTAAAVVDVDTGRYSVLPTELRDSRVAALRWLAADRIELGVDRSGQSERRYFTNVRGQWQVAEAPPGRSTASLRVRFELRQSLDTPPRLYAVDTGSGEARLILDPNPDLLTRFRLGSVERIEGDTAAGERWAGLLFYPPGYRAERRYPLVIQSVYGSALSEEFTLYGVQQDAGLGPTSIAAYPGRLLVARDILVLHMDVTKGRQFGTPAEPEVRQRAFEAAAQQLVQAGLVDRQRVGLLGFSRNGYYVEHTLTHSAFPFAAAISADNWDPSYMANTLGGFSESAADIHGAGPFGAGLAKWIGRAPGFNAERIRTPLLTIVQSTGMLDVLLKWELFARLRHLDKAVELYVMPDSMYGAHCTQNPRQILAVQQRSIDWFDFWLNGREDADESKTHQYERWRVLRDQAKKDQTSRAAYVPR